MGAVKSNQNLNEPDKFISRYGGVPVIYVESDDDHYVYGECWFKDRLSKVEFRPAKTKCATDGCDAVCNAVSMERRAGNPAWGIVDRDMLMSKELWDIVCETDDDAYEQSKPFGINIKVLCRWEMESYLADGEALEHIQASLNKKQQRPLCDVFHELLEHCHILIPHASINAVLHRYKSKGVGDGFTNRFSNQEDVTTCIQKNTIPKLPSTAQSDYDIHLKSVAEFDLSDGTPADKRVKALLRRIHGKALLERFLHVSHNIQVDVRGLLANRIKEKACIPSEIDNFIEYVVGNPGRA